MTRCYKSSSTLKSSVFNQTGQTFIDQIEVQRTLCAHFRRILSAKSVVDSRNPRYLKMMHRKTRPATAKKFLLKCPSDETIDKLAYDTEHHPCDLVRVQCRSKSTSHDRSWSGDRQRPINNDANYPRPKAHTSRDRSSTGKLSGKNEKRPATTSRSQQPSKDKCGSTTCRSTRSKGCRYEEVSEQSGRSPKQLQEASLWRFEEQCYQNEEEARYARFVYDITQEIVQNGLYTDCELKEVFEKHLRKNSGHLSRRKMLYEIYQLKISLNMMDDTDDEDEVETDLVFAEKFSTHRVPKPPTPPKILNENKVIEKLESFKQLESCRQLDSLADAMPTSTCCRKSVTLVDANPEFLVTERDVLSTLADNHVEPHQIERICRKLYQKSKDMTLCEAVQVGSEVAYTYRLKQVDRCTSAASLSDICYSKKESRGILRKECGTSSKSLSPMSFRKYGFVKVKDYDGQKCARWAIGECDCEEQPCLQHTEPPERLRKSIKIEDSSTSIPTKCNCNCELKRQHAASADTSPRKQKRSSLKQLAEKPACDDHKKYEKFVDGTCDYEALPCSKHTVPPLQLNRRSAIVCNEEEKWKKEDSTEITHAKKEDMQKAPQKSSKISDEEKNQSRKSSKTSSEEKDRSRKSSKLSAQDKNQSRKSSKSSEKEKDQSQRSSKLSEKEKELSQKSSKFSEQEKDESRKSSKLSDQNKNDTGKPNKLAEQKIEEKTPARGQKNLKIKKVRSNKSARRSSSESSLSDMQPEVQKPLKSKRQKANFTAPITPVVMRSRLPSEHLKSEERISTESSEISSESDEPTASAIITRRPSQLSEIASKGTAEASERMYDNEGDGEENKYPPSPGRSRKISLTTSADTSNRTSGDFDLEYSKYARRSTAESQKDLELHLESTPQVPQERKKDVPKDRMPTKVPFESKSISEFSDRSDSISNKSTLSEDKRPASLTSRVLINVLNSPKSPRISEMLALSSQPLEEDVLMEKLERIQSAGDVESILKEKDSVENQTETSISPTNFKGSTKSEKPNSNNKLSFHITHSPKDSPDAKRSLLVQHFRNRKSSVLFQIDKKSPKKRDHSHAHNPTPRKSARSSTSRSRQSSYPIEKIPKEEKQASSGKDESSDNEEIEEEIDTASETTARSPREQTKKEAEREAEKKRQMLAREAAKALEEEEKDEDADEEERYSDDFSDVSDSPRKSEEAAKVQQRFVPSMRDFLESFAQMNEPKAPHVSSGSSGSDSLSMLSLNVPSGSLDETALSTPVIKKRTSSGVSGYKIMETWNERLSELSRDLYVNPVARYCDPRCRSSLIAKTCSGNCKFAKTNCSHIKEPTDCIKSDEDNSASSQESSF